jgi:acetyl esterase/lipase
MNRQLCHFRGNTEQTGRGDYNLTVNCRLTKAPRSALYRFRVNCTNTSKTDRMNEAFINMPPADVSHIHRKWLDLTYASLSPAQKLDIYLPDEGDGPFPIILYIHGGAFAIGDKLDAHILTFLKGLERGYAVVSVNYRLSGEAIFPAGLQDIKSAIRWLRANNEQYHLDENRIAACGGSSGGNYAAMICLTDHVTEFDDPRLGNPEYPCNVQAAVDWFGPTDFLKMDEQLCESGFGPSDHGEADSPESRYLGAKLSLVPLKVELANPMTYIHKNMPPILIQHGRLDSLVPVQQSMTFAEKLGKYVSSDRFEFDILEGAGHGDPLFETEENMARVFSFLDKHLK